MPTDPISPSAIDETLAELLTLTHGRADVRAADLQAFTERRAATIAADPKKDDEVCILCDAPNDVCDPCDNKDMSCTGKDDVFCVTCDTADV